MQVSVLLVQPCHKNVVGVLVQAAARLSVAPSAGVLLLAVTVQFGAVSFATGTTSPPDGVQKTIGSAGLPSPSGM